LGGERKKAIQRNKKKEEENGAMLACEKDEKTALRMAHEVLMRGIG